MSVRESLVLHFELLHDLLGVSIVCFFVEEVCVQLFFAHVCDPRAFFVDAHHSSEALLDLFDETGETAVLICVERVEEMTASSHCLIIRSEGTAAAVDAFGEPDRGFCDCLLFPSLAYL